MQDPNEDTEWNDLLRKHGIIPEKPPSPSAALEEAVEEALEKAHANRLEGATLEELDELESDGLEDEDFIQMYRKKRIAEIKAQVAKEKFGEVAQIRKQEYTDEITNASKQVPVVVHIKGDSSEQSRLLSALLTRTATKFKDVKFVQIDCRQINDKFPLDQTPTILVYKNGNVVKQLVTLNTIGGNSTNLQDIEKFLTVTGVLSQSDERLLENQDQDSDSDFN